MPLRQIKAAMREAKLRIEASTFFYLGAPYLMRMGCLSTEALNGCENIEHTRRIKTTRSFGSSVLLQLVAIVAALIAFSASAGEESERSQTYKHQDNTGHITSAAEDASPVPNSSAQEAFAKYGSSIYQVRIINIKSENLSSSGSGFFIHDGSYFATNYHVVSSVVFEPEEYKIIIELGDDETELKIAAIDVVNDLALLKAPTQQAALQLKTNPPEQGERLFSVGNPHNLGMTIVEGTYNGLAEDYIFDRIHFSGAINPGMSGGPTINGEGEVVGINVQTGGNQLGFLVPVEKLIALVADHFTPRPSAPVNTDASFDPSGDSDASEEYLALQETIGKQVHATTSKIIDDIVKLQSWPTEELAGETVIAKLHPGFSCWGNSHKNKKKHLSRVNKGCSSQQFIYIRPRLNTGYFEYKFELLNGEGWPSGAFYRYASRNFSNDRAPNRASEKDVENFNCIDEVLAAGDSRPKRKVSYCSRTYKKFPNLFDSFFLSVTLNQKNQALMETFWLTGVSKQASQSFLTKFLAQRGSSK